MAPDWAFLWPHVIPYASHITYELRPLCAPPVADNISGAAAKLKVFANHLNQTWNCSAKAKSIHPSPLFDVADAHNVAVPTPQSRNRRLLSFQSSNYGYWRENVQTVPTMPTIAWNQIFLILKMSDSKLLPLLQVLVEFFLGWASENVLASHPRRTCWTNLGPVLSGETIHNDASLPLSLPCSTTNTKQMSWIVMNCHELST